MGLGKEGSFTITRLERKRIIRLEESLQWFDEELR